MKLEVIGTNSAFAKCGATTSLLWRRGQEDFVLLDCGFPIFQLLLQKEYLPRVKTVLLSHLHQDHCGSAVALLEYRKYVLGERTAIGGADWDKLLSLCEGENYADIIAPLPADMPLETWEVPHGKGMRCLAMLVDGRLLYSGDSAVSVLDTEAAARAKIIVHDAHLYGNPMHVSVAELGKAAPEIKAKTWLIHYLPKDYESLQEACRRHGLAGVLQPGMVLETE